MSQQPPDNPAGEFTWSVAYDEQVKQALIKDIRLAPLRLADTVGGLTDPELNTLYKNWTIRQIVHHLADSHLHSYIRFKWTLTELEPTIKAYQEADWVDLDDCRLGDIAPALLLLNALHAKWLQVLESMTAEQFARTFMHPQTMQAVSLWEALNYYAWHAKHHTAQIQWLRQHATEI